MKSVAEAPVNLHHPDIPISGTTHLTHRALFRDGKENSMPKAHVSILFRRIIFSGISIVPVCCLLNGCGALSVTPGGSGSTPPTGSGSVNSINHVIFMLQENHYLRQLFRHAESLPQSKRLEHRRRRQGLRSGWHRRQADNTISNEDDEGTSYSLFKFTSTCIDDDELRLAGELRRRQSLRFPDHPPD